MWVVVALCSLVVLVVLVLCIPVDLVLDLDTAGGPKSRVRLTWLFGLISKEVSRREKKPEKKERRRKRPNLRTIIEILRTRGFLRQLQRLIRDIFRRLEIKRLECDLRVGLDDPADTGFLFAVIGPVTVFLSNSLFRHIRIEPSFEGAVFQGHAHGAIRVRPIKLVPPLMWFVFSLSTMRVLKRLVLTKWRRRK